MKIAVLLTVYNRRESTLRSLQHLYSQELPFKCTLEVFMVDDGCTDRTADAVSHTFPQVRVIEGTGNLFWNQGMRLAWNTAAKAGDWDSFLWLNDDTILQEGAVKNLIVTLTRQREATGKRGIVAGSCFASAGGEQVLTYGGLRCGQYLQPTDQPQEINRFNGNLVLVSNEAFYRLGNLCPVYRHSLGDIDYGIRASRHGVPVWLAPGFLAECNRNARAIWLDPEVPLFERWKAFRGPKGFTIAELRAFAEVRGQRLWVLSVINQYATVIFPRRLLKKTGKTALSL